jgi:hypothetical protein
MDKRYNPVRIKCMNCKIRFMFYNVNRNTLSDELTDNRIDCDKCKKGK